MAIDFPNTPSVGSTFTAGGKTWQWDGAKWIAASSSSVYPPNANVGRNLLHNGLINIQQRGAGGFAAGVGTVTYGADRWFTTLGASGDTATTAIAAISDAQRGQIGDEAATSCLSTSFTGGSAGANYVSVIQRIENVRRTSNKTVTLSFWSNATAALIVGVSLAQSFGTGGSPSANVNTPYQTVTLATGTNWQRFAMTFNLPSVAGKTFGTTAGTDMLSLTLLLSAGAGNSSGVPTQSGTINFWGMQLEIGNQATALEKLDPRMDLANCQRFCLVAQAYHVGYQVAASALAMSMSLPVPMRTAPTLTITTNNDNNVSSPGQATLANNVALYFNGVATSTGPWIINRNFTASADL